MGSSKTAGHKASVSGEKPRAQVSYEGADEFSVMSTEPARRKKDVDLKPTAPGTQDTPEIDDLKPKERGFTKFVRRFFG